jgi:hypothetical protein
VTITQSHSSTLPTERGNVRTQIPDIDTVPGGLKEGAMETDAATRDTRPPAATPVARLRDEAYAALRDALPAANLEEALRCSARLLAALPDRTALHRNLVMVAYGGGKDSSYTLAFVRAMQLILYRVHGTTFRLRSATNRHAGMPRAVLENIDREYRALRLPEDPDCELLLVDGNEVSTFDVDSPQREHVVRRNRLDILMTGHRTYADGRPTFCNACNLSVFNSFGVAAAHGGGADLIVTGDSKDEQRQYTAWVGRMTRRLAVPVLAPSAPGADAAGPGRLLARLDAIGRSYFADIHGEQASGELAERRVTSAVPEQLRFFSIYGDTAYRAGDHMEMLTGFLGFRFDDLAFSFTESDCGNPALMAHLRGLKIEHVYQRPYDEGLAEYVDFALGLMQAKDFPPGLVETMRARYAGPGAADRMRRAAERYALETFGLTEEQLVCMVYSPFAEKGAGLAEFLRREHPALAGRAEEIRTLLADDAREGSAAADAALADELRRISGLELSRLRVLHGKSLRRPEVAAGTGARAGVAAGAEPDVIGTVLEGDPHKAVVRTRPAPTAEPILELISGR